MAHISFLDFQLDSSRGELRQGNHSISLEPKVLDLISHFVRHPGELVTRDDLIQTVWEGRIVSDSAISSAINAARVALGDDGTAQRFIKTIPRRGFRFEIPVEADTTEPPRFSQDKPAIAVLPFENLSGDLDQRYFSDGITDDIITDLSRYNELFVIARHSSFAFRDSSIARSKIAADLGVRYLVEGSIRRIGQRVRMNVQLVDTSAGNTLWAERYNREMRDIFALQDEITGLIVNSVAGRIERQHYLRLIEKGPNATSAYDHTLRATMLFWSFGSKANEQARQEAEAAIAFDPRLARAHAILTFTYITEGSNLWGNAPQKAIELAYQTAMTAVETDDQEPWAHAALGMACLWRGNAHSQSLDCLERALKLNPSNAQFRSFHALSLAYHGRNEQSLDGMRLVMKQNPFYPVIYGCWIGRALFNLKRYAEALPHLEPAIRAMPDHSNAMALVAATYAALGRSEDASNVVDLIKSANPKFTLSSLPVCAPFADPRDLEHYTSMLAKSGLPNS